MDGAMQVQDAAGGGGVQDVVVARLNHLLESVCSQNDLALAEVLTPREDGTCLVQVIKLIFIYISII